MTSLNKDGLARFGLDATDLDMIRSGAKVYAALQSLSAHPVHEAGEVVAYASKKAIQNIKDDPKAYQYLPVTGEAERGKTVPLVRLSALKASQARIAELVAALEEIAEDAVHTSFGLKPTPGALIARKALQHK